MRRLARRLFTLCSALSLLLCVAVCACVLWVQSSGTSAEWNFDTGRHDCSVRFIQGRRFLHGRLLLSWVQQANTPGRAFSSEFRSRNPYPHFLGFAYKVAPAGRPTGRGGTVWASQGLVMAPLWAFLLVTAALPAGWASSRLGQWRRGRRLASGLCLQCGYDLRASPVRCPECRADTPRDSDSHQKGRSCKPLHP